MPKRLLVVDNIAQVAPIGDQFPAMAVNKPSELEVVFDKQASTLPVKDADPTASNTAANLIYSEDHRFESWSELKDGTQIPTLYEGSARPFMYSPGLYIFAPLGVPRDCANGNVSLKLSAGGQNYYPKYGGAFEFVYYTSEEESETLKPNAVAKSNFTKSASTLFKAMYDTMTNLQIKIPNAYNRDIPFTSMSEEDRLALMYSYHCAVFQLLLFIDRYSGLISSVYHMNKTIGIDVANVKPLYDPEVYSALQIAYLTLKQFPILDTVTASAIQRLTKCYAANEVNYYPGAYINIDAEVPSGYADGATTATSLARAVQFTQDTYLFDTAFLSFAQEVSGGVNEGAIGLSCAMVDSLFNESNRSELTKVLGRLGTVMQSISETFKYVIQYLIQANKQGLYKVHTLGEFVDFDASDNDKAGIIVYDIVKDYNINNMLKNFPVLMRQEGGATPVLSLIMPLNSLQGYYSVKPGVRRLFGPYTMADDIYNTQELISMGVWSCSMPFDDSELTVIKNFGKYKELVTGACFYSNPMVRFNISEGGRVNLIPIGDVVTKGSQRTLNNINAMTSGWYAWADEGVLGTGNFQRAQKSIATDLIIDAFDLLWMPQTVKKVATIDDSDELHVHLGNDTYLFSVATSTLLTANASFYTEAVERVSWLDYSKPSSAAKKPVADGKPAGSF